MKNKVILISKDVFMRGYLPVYGNKYWKTPNIDDLASKGTVFMKHYTAAPSTAMAFTSMFTGLYAYETDRKKYTEVSEFKGDTFFDKLYQDGYMCHVVWDKSYVKLAQRFSKCYGKHTVIHDTDFLTRPQPPHVKGQYDDMRFYPELEEICLTKMEKLTQEIANSADKVFMWVHFPHVLLGRNAYGSDIDVMDKMIGMLRQYFDDDAIFITADHGHMNGTHGKYGYGFDVNQQAILIPLITPRINGLEKIDVPSSNTQLQDIIRGNFVPKDIIFSETAYYQQPHRKIAVIKGNYKYIYEKATKKEFLFDVDWDPDENINLLETEIFDLDRKKYYSVMQRFFYPHWNDDLPQIAAELRTKKDKLWRNAPFLIEMKEHILQFGRRVKMRYFEKF